LACAAIEAGFPNYDTAVRSLTKTAELSEEQPLALTEKAMQSIAGFIADESQFDRI
jgi:hypothetical protein